MKEASRRMAVCGMLAALSVVLMLLGSVFGVLVYVCPILTGLATHFVRTEYGARYALTMFSATGLVALMLVPDLEMTAIYLGVAGWYPAVKPTLDKLPRGVNWGSKLLLFNGAVVLAYQVLMAVMGVDGTELGAPWEWMLLLVLGNLVFVLYDRALGRLTARRMGQLFRHFLRH